MFDPSSIIVGLEIGTSKVCAVVGELSADGALNIVGLGQARSRGVRKGEIADAPAAEEDVRHAIVEAEQMADVEIRSVYLGVTGGHVRGFNNRGVHPVVSADREIYGGRRAGRHQERQDHQPARREPRHPRHSPAFPRGRPGRHHQPGRACSARASRWTCTSSTATCNRLQNAIRTVKGLQLEVDDIVFNGLASSLALLTNEQKELGSLVIDIGGGTTEYVVYANGIIKHTGVLAVGGDHVSNDLAYGLKSAAQPRRAAQDRARRRRAGRRGQRADSELHRQRAGAAAQDQSTSNICAASCRCGWRKSSSSSRQDLEQAGALDYLRAGVFLCGGGARIPQIAKLAEQVLQMPVSLGKTNSISGLKSALDQPEFATRHRPGEIRLVPAAQTRRQIVPDRRDQEHPGPVLQTRLNSKPPYHDHAAHKPQIADSARGRASAVKVFGVGSAGSQRPGR